jgi:O-acetyl-ADP-ribose deacetylase (regulator of RNase III)
MWDN